MNTKTERVQADVMVYVLDCTKIGSEGDLASIKNWFDNRPELYQISSHANSCVFVGNKIDSADSEPAQMLQEIQRFIEKAVTTKFSSSQFVVCSAQRAFLTRAKANDCLPEKSWNAAMKKYGRVKGEDDKLLELFSDHRVDKLESLLYSQIWNQKLSVILENHAQHIS